MFMPSLEKVQFCHFMLLLMDGLKGEFSTYYF